uniref:C3H1-type domain-containing protein n=1 Tax=Neobodo designis TaxID=312471 RepID=A0A7S1W458_NEODS|mmetsp:Transcript_51821/g.159687  ORF Transcript_51821/g.159687 Transcript_51821/m.159687 type:complete len:316 (+) Transcript_51821:302-1249(+)|eukprot:CAMPEP_0174852338 /NCGR_PEP_ID=MMETSP1114-20130205/25314_1 /TAXON_ID=312471 /ORGANISM="Neobodo designis, Strain CCAP 1951/1" /LENGTH=315 /DNA_ID=CAMNT_0016086925 /DNA_START=300 /DNA_END=1247 /DNA_ORIENTATION=+
MASQPSSPFLNIFGAAPDGSVWASTPETAGDLLGAPATPLPPAAPPEMLGEAALDRVAADRSPSQTPQAYASVFGTHWSIGGASVGTNASAAFSEDTGNGSLASAPSTRRQRTWSPGTLSVTATGDADARRSSRGGAASAAGGATSANANSNNNSIVAERYKTKMCKNYEKRGECPYTFRCMFAHGSAELRTKEQNLAEGIVDQAAVFALRRRMASGGGHSSRHSTGSPSAWSSGGGGGKKQHTPPPPPAATSDAPLTVSAPPEPPSPQLVPASVLPSAWAALAASPAHGSPVATHHPMPGFDPARAVTGGGDQR